MMLNLTEGEFSLRRKLLKMRLELKNYLSLLINLKLKKLLPVQRKLTKPLPTLERRLRKPRRRLLPTLLLLRRKSRSISPSLLLKKRLLKPNKRHNYLNSRQHLKPTLRHKNWLLRLPLKLEKILKPSKLLSMNRPWLNVVLSSNPSSETSGPPDLLVFLWLNLLSNP